MPSHWMFAADDSSMPSPDSVVRLSRLASQGLPISYKVYPDTERGMVMYRGQGRERQAVSYHPDYFNDMIDWLRKQASVAGEPQRTSHVTARACSLSFCS
jgi:predicted peptidase